MPTHQATLARIDTFVTAALALITQDQTDYRNVRNRFGQVLRSHRADIHHTQFATGDAAPDNVRSRPTDQTETFEQVLGRVNLLAVWPCTARIDVYDGPQGKGWILRYWMLFDGVRYSKARQVGPETHREHDWISG